MTFRYSGQLNLPQNGYDDYFGRYRYLPSACPVPNLSWRLRVGYESSTECYYFEWEDAKPMHLTSASFQVKTARNGTTLLHASLGSPSSFPPTSSGRINGSEASGFGRVYVDVELRTGATPADEAIEKIEQERVMFAFLSSTTLLERTSANVCLRFPRSGKRLWASESFLKQSSPYFQQLLSSGFVKGQTEYCDRLSSDQVLVAYTFDESDEETDKLEVKAFKSKNEFDTPFKTVTITDSAYSTYFAVLVWLQSRHISFAPLLSTFSSPGKASQEVVSAHSKAIADLRSKAPSSLPPPVSPRSIYRLSHLLELAELSSLALENLMSQLTPSNAAYELYSDVATCYPAVRDVVVDYVVEHWDMIKSDASMQEMEDKANSGELAGGVAVAGTSMLLARKLMEKYKP